MHVYRNDITGARYLSEVSSEILNCETCSLAINHICEVRCYLYYKSLHPTFKGANFTAYRFDVSYLGTVEEVPLFNFEDLGSLRGFLKDLPTFYV